MGQERTSESYFPAFFFLLVICSAPSPSGKALSVRGPQHHNFMASGLREGVLVHCELLGNKACHLYVLI